jgi:hypothetical protein
MSDKKMLSNQEFLALKLVHCQLCTVTFLKDYVQLNFDGPMFNFYEFPTVKVGDEEFNSKRFGYCDKICSLIGKAVAYVDEIENFGITIKFEDESTIFLSLKLEDRSSVEAAMFQAGNNEGWIVW